MLNKTITDAIQSVTSIAFFILSVVAGIYVKNKDKIAKIEAKNKIVGDVINHAGKFAEWAVYQQEATNNSNESKKENATQYVVNETKKAGFELSKDLAGGAVEVGVEKMKNAPTDTPLAKEVPVSETPKVELKPVEEPLLDDLQVNKLN